MHKFRKAIASLSVIALLSTFVVSTAVFAGTFGDVPADSYYYSSVEDLAAMGILDASRESFEPARNLQRDEAAKLIVASAGKETVFVDEGHFVDVPKSLWSFDYVETAYAYGVVGGYSHMPGYFGPADPVTREQFAKMVVEAFDFPECLPEGGQTFPDVNAGMWSYSYVETAYCYGIVNGYPDGTFGPTKNINRAEGSVMISRALNAEGPIVDWDEDEEEDEEPVEGEIIGGELSVKLNAGTPVGTTLPSGATSVPMVTWDFTAGEEGATLKSLQVGRYGVSSLPNNAQVYLYEGNDRLTSGKSVNTTTNLANFNNVNLNFGSNETRSLTLRLDVGTVVDTGEVGFEIKNADALTGADLSGSFPVMGNLFGLSTTAAGTITVEKNGTVPNPKVGEDDVTVAKFKLTTAGEAASLEQLNLYVTGSVSGDALENFRLYVSGQDDPIATVDSLSAKDLARFELDPPYEIAKGDTRSFTMKVDLNTGRTDDTVKVYVDETTDVVAIGDTYRFGMTVNTGPSPAPGGSYDAVTNACTSSDGDCTFSTIEGGDITVTSAGPSATDIPVAGDDVTLMNFSIVSISDLTFKNFPVSLTASEGVAAQGLLDATASNLTDIKIVNRDTGETLMGPVDSSSFVTALGGATAITEAAGDNLQAFYLFTDEFDMEAGEELNLALKVDVANKTALEGMTVQATVELGTTYPEMRDANNKTITNTATLVPTTPITGKSMTVAAPSLELALAAVPVSAESHVKGEQNVQFLGVSVKCGASSDCKVTDVNLSGYINDTGGTTFGPLYLGRDTVSTNDVYLNEIVGSVWLEDGAGNVVASSKSIQSSGSIVFDSMDWPLNGGETEILYVVGNVSSDAYKNANNESVAFSIAAGGIAYEDDNGNTRNSTGIVNATQSMYKVITAGGVLTVYVDSSTPKETIAVAGTANQEISKFKFAAASEGFVVKKLTINNRQSGVATAANIGDYDNNVSQVKIEYTNSAGETETKTGYLTNGVAQFSGLDLYVEKDDDTLMTVYATLNTISGGATAGAFVDLTVAYNNFEAVADASGETYKASKADNNDGSLVFMTGGIANVPFDFTGNGTLDGALAGLVLGSSFTFDMDDGGVPAAPNRFYPVGTLVCFDVNANGVCDVAAESVAVVTGRTAASGVGVVADTYNAILVSSGGGAGVVDNTAIGHALPGTHFHSEANMQHVYETVPTLTLDATSPSGSRTTSASDTIFKFNVSANANEKVVLRAARSLDTCTANTGTTLTSATSATAVDGSACELTAINLLDRGANFATTGLQNYRYVSFWVRFNDNDAAVALNTTDLKVGTAVAAGAPDQATVLAAANVNGATTLAEDTWYYVYDVAMPTGTDSADTLLQILVADATRLNEAADDLFIDQVKLYNDKVRVRLASDGKLAAGAHTLPAYLKGGTSNVTGYVSQASTSSAFVDFYPSVNLETSKGSTTNYYVETDTNTMMTITVNDDLLTPSINHGSYVDGAVVTSGDFWWSDTNAPYTVGGVAKATIDWLGYQSSSALNGHTLKY